MSTMPVQLVTLKPASWHRVQSNHSLRGRARATRAWASAPDLNQTLHKHGSRVQACSEWAFIATGHAANMYGVALVQQMLRRALTFELAQITTGLLQHGRPVPTHGPIEHPPCANHPWA
eukprot:15469640-Alexandrium_andersonii.AAC.2